MRVIILIVFMCSLQTYCFAQSKINSRYQRELLAVSLPIRSGNITDIVTSKFTYRKHPSTGIWHHHKGIDLAVNFVPIYNVLIGKVIKTGYDKRSGNFIVVQHINDVQTIYCHLSEIYILPSQIIPAGMKIGQSGNSGSSTGPHLHFALKIKGKAIDPLPFLLLIEKKVRLK